MKEQFVTYEIALKLKELGFDEECLASFNNINKELTYSISTFYTNQNHPTNAISAPLWQQAIDWLREKHNIAIFVDMNCMEDTGYTFYIGNLISRETIFENYENIDIYENTREQAILKSIELININTNEQLISFETAKLAKEKGFHINFPNYVYRELGILREVLDCTGGSCQKDEYAAPTQSLLQKWLRDNHNIDISIHRSFSMNKSYHYTILINCDYDNIIQQICEPNRNYETSLELALQEALKNIKN